MGKTKSRPKSILSSSSTAVTRLADAVLVELGEKKPTPVKKKRARPREQAKESSAPVTMQATAQKVAWRHCCGSGLRTRATDRIASSSPLAGRSNINLDDASALATIRDYARQRPFLRSWSDDDIVNRLRDAEKVCHRGRRIEIDAEGCIHLGGRDPQYWTTRAFAEADAADG